jgi:ABC-type Fe3+ transport system permease subunit
MPGARPPALSTRRYSRPLPANSLLAAAKRRFSPLHVDLEIVVFLYLPLLVLLLGFVVPILTIITHATAWGVLDSPTYIDFSSEAFAEPILVQTATIGNHSVIQVKIRGFNFGVIGNSLFIAAVVTVASAALGTAVALLTGFYVFPGRRLFRVLAFVPLLIAPFVNSYVVTRLLMYKGTDYNVVSFILSKIFTEPLLGKSLYFGFTGQAGVIVSQILMFYPIVYINALAALGVMDATLVEQALNLGARGATLLRRIVLPLILPGILAGSTLVFILSLEDLAAPVTFKFYKVMSYYIYSKFQVARASSYLPMIATLSTVMLVAALVPMFFVRRYLSLRYYAKLTRGAPRPFRGLRLGRRGVIAAYLIVLPLVLLAAAPQFGVVALAFSRGWEHTFPSILPKDVIFYNFKSLVEIDGIRRSILNSLYYLGHAIVFIALLGFMAGYAISRARLPGTSVLDLLSSAPLAVPGLVVAFSYLVFFSAHPLGDFLSLSAAASAAAMMHVLILAYILRKLPFTVRAVFTSMIQTPEELEEAARSLGARRIRVISRIVLPLTWRGVVAGLLLSAIYVLSEVSVSVTLGALNGDMYSPTHIGPITFAILQLIEMPRVSTVSLPDGSLVAISSEAQAAALATLLMLIEVAVILVSTRLARRGQALVTI